jgi:hypothetical protein
LKFSPAEEKERLAKYNQIADAAAELLKKIPDHLKDAYFELIYYPVVGAQLMNEKILYAHWSLDPALSLIRPWIMQPGHQMPSGKYRN